MSNDDKPKNLGGRPSHVPTEVNRITVRNNMGWLGWSEEKMAKHLGISIMTLRKHYAEEIDAGNAALMALMVNKGVEFALGRPAVIDPVTKKVIQAEVKASERMVEFFLRTKGGFHDQSKSAVPFNTIPADKLPELDYTNATNEELEQLSKILESIAARGSNGKGQKESNTRRDN